MKKSCYDCFNFIAKIPLIHNGNSKLTSRLDYNNATATCKYGLLVKAPGDKVRVFKRVLVKNANHKLDSYAQAERCQEYDGETD